MFSSSIALASGVMLAMRELAKCWAFSARIQYCHCRRVPKELTALGPMSVSLPKPARQQIQGFLGAFFLLFVMIGYIYVIFPGFLIRQLTCQTGAEVHRGILWQVIS
jgi:hypothetical protein